MRKRLTHMKRLQSDKLRDSDLAPLTIENEWRELDRLAVPADADDDQRTDMRRCFYAGATAVVDTLVALLEVGNEVQVLAYLVAAQNEITAFRADLQREIEQEGKS